MMADGTGTLESVSIDWRHPEPVRKSAPAARAWSEPVEQSPAEPDSPDPSPPVVSPASLPNRPVGFVERLRRALMRSADAPPTSDIAAAPVTTDPLAIRQRLYGRGYIIPGDVAWLLSLVGPLQLGASSSLLDLAAGLGGPARAIAQASHARVTGIERDYDCARQANAMSAALGVSHLLRIKACDPEGLELGSAKFDCALGREASYTLVDKERFLRVVAQALRPRGQILLTDFVLDRGAGDRLELDAWRGSLAQRPSLWTAAQYTDCFKSVGYGLRRVEDISAVYRRQIVGAWMGYLRTGEIRGQPAAHVEAVLAEAEACFRTVAALETGALKYYRFEAIQHYSFW